MKLSHLAAPALILMATPAWAADGCPDGSYSVTPNTSSSSVLFGPDFQVESQTGRTTLTCNLSVADGDPAKVPPSGTFYAYSADYSAFVAPDKAAEVTVTANGTVKVLKVRPSDEGVDGFLMRTYVGPDGDGNLNSQINLTATGDGFNPVASVDGVDFDFLASTTLDTQLASLDQLSGQATAVNSRLATLSGLLTKDGAAPERDNEVGLFGAVGSATVGATAHYNLGDGLSLDGGAALFWQGVDGNDLSGLMFAGKASYLTPEDGSAFRWLGSAGVNATPGLSMNFSRDYQLGSLTPDDFTTATGKAAGTGLMVGAFVEGGVLIAPAPDNEVVFAVSYARNWLNFGDTAEAQTDQNPFAFSSDGTSTFDTIKARADWTVGVMPDVDLTLHGAVGHVFASDYSGDVALVGPLTVGGTDESFAEYGAKVGWQFADNANVGAFVLGSTGTVSGTHVQVGTSVSMKF